MSIVRALIVALALSSFAPAPVLGAGGAEVARMYREGYDRYLQGDLPGAAAWFEQVLRSEPDHKAARNRLAEVYLSLGRADDARKVIGGGSGLDPATDPQPPTPAVAQGPAAPAPAPSPVGTPGGSVAPLAPAAPPAPTERMESTPPPAASQPSVAPPPADPPARVAVAEDEPKPPKRAPLSPEERAKRRNPRASSRLGAGVGLIGGVGAVGLWFEARPAWPIAVAVAGGLLPVGGMHGVFSAQVTFLPAPYRLTPVLGLGAGVLLGPSAWLLDPFVAAAARGARARATLWPVVGLRLDLGPRFTATVAADLLPGRHATLPIVPVPSVRAGVRF